VTDQAPLPCTHCGAIDQRVACVRSGAQHQRSAFQFLCVDTAGCAERFAAREAQRLARPVLTSDERNAANRAAWAAKKLAMGWA
jgi:hypothetical protein